MTTQQNIVPNFTNGGAWKGRGRLEDLMAELERQRESKVDVVLDGRQLLLTPRLPKIDEKTGKRYGGRVELGGLSPQVREFLGTGTALTDKALPQLGERLSPSLPTRVMREMADQHPDLLADMANQLFARNAQKHLVRMLDGRVRSIHSNCYRCLDHYDLAFHALDVGKSHGAALLEGTLTDSKMRLVFVGTGVRDYIDTFRSGDKGSWYAGGFGDQKHLSKVHARSVAEQLPGLEPNTLLPVVTVSNSETGQGGMTASCGILLAGCFNLAIVEDRLFQAHLGKAMEPGVLRPETIKAEAEAIMLKARDVIGVAFDSDRFSSLVDRLRPAAERRIDSPTSAVSQIVKDYSLSEAAKDSILAHFMGDYKPTQFGLAQAVARHAQSVEDADDAQELERLAGKLMLA